MLRGAAIWATPSPMLNHPRPRANCSAFAAIDATSIRENYPCLCVVLRSAERRHLDGNRAERVVVPLAAKMFRSALRSVPTANSVVRRHRGCFCNWVSLSFGDLQKPTGPTLCRGTTHSGRASKRKLPMADDRNLGGFLMLMQVY
jgi:hypothetical protein